MYCWRHGCRRQAYNIYGVYIFVGILYFRLINIYKTLMKAPDSPSKYDSLLLAQKIKSWGKTFGLQQIGICDTSLENSEQKLHDWLQKNFHGSMHYMEKHGNKRSRPELLMPGTLSVISARMDYFPAQSRETWDVLTDKNSAYISRYALGRDYHKVFRQKLKRLAEKIEQEIGVFGYRVFVDSAPVLEKPLAEKAGLGWVGKHSNVLSRDAGSWFFLGEIYVDIELPVDHVVSNHCGKCTKCIDECPTQAIVAPYTVDSRRCISYLTIENKKSIPAEFRKAMGNRIYGCDDCQLVCPWNRFATPTAEPDFAVRHGLDSITLMKLFAWDEATFLKKTEGSAIRRIGYECWMRNIAVALGNADYDLGIVELLQNKLGNASDMLDEHIEWALLQQLSKQNQIKS